MKSKILMNGGAVAAVTLMCAAPAFAQTAGNAHPGGPAAALGSNLGGQRLQNSTAPAPSDANASSSKLSEVVVTARKTTENLQRAPASIVAVSGDALVKQSITSPLQLEKVLPSANLHEEGAVTQTFIRGVGTRTDTPNFAGASTFLFDGIVIPRYGTTGLLFDLGTVQAIAGPQGTLYGGSAAGGAINLNSAQPRNGYAGSGVLEGGDYAAFHGAVAQDVALGDKLSLRGAVDYNRHDGYYSDGLDGEDRLSGRISARVKPTEDLSVLLFFNDAREVGRPNASIIDNPPQHDPYNLPTIGPKGTPISTAFSFQDNRTAIAGANIEWRLGDNVFTYIPGYVHLRDNYQEYIAGYNLLGVHDRETQHTEELRWARTLGALKLNAGGFYLNDKTIFGDDFGFAAVPAPPYYFFSPINRTDQINESYAFFAQGVYSIIDSLRATAGVRYTDDRIHASGLGASGPFDFGRSQTHVDYKVGLDYDLLPRVLIYGNIQTGYIPFGYNPDVTPSSVVPTSKLLAYSGGVKSRFLDNRLEVNDELFYYDYRHFQAIDFVSLEGRSIVLNADKGTIYGNDFSMRALLTKDTQLDASVVALHSEFNRFSGPGYDYTGNRFADAPTLNLIAGLQHSVPIWSGALLGRVSTHYESGHFGEFTNNLGTHQRAYTNTDLSLTYNPNGARWSIQGYVNNVEDTPVFGTIATVSSPQDAAGPLAPPRTYGIRLTASWN